MTLSPGFWLNVPTNDVGCKEWTGSRNEDNYGRWGRFLAHRLAWQEMRGDVPAGMQVLHSCDNPPCVNVDHLWLGTHADNMRDKDEKKRHFNSQKTHCPLGHPYDANNTFLRKSGARACLTCKRTRDREARARWRAEDPERAKQVQREWYARKKKAS